jgi:hypothetical protein
MPQVFHLYWLRESGCDTGTPLRADQLEPEIQQRVLDLAGTEEGEIALRLPYLDRREWPQRGPILASLPLERHDNVISCLPEPAAAIRHTAATLALTHPAWLGAPSPTHPDHFALWRNVSMTLQISLRAWIAEQYFRDPTRFEDRNKAYSMLVYQSARVCHGRPRGEFTYAFHDYPACRLTLALALRMTGRNLQTILVGVEQRLNQAGMPELARRYAPVWHQDMVVAVRKKPKLFLALLGAESAFINALVDLSLDQTPAGVHSFSKAANRALRKACGTGVAGMDLRPLGVRALELATEILAAGRWQVADLPHAVHVC